MKKLLLKLTAIAAIVISVLSVVAFLGAYIMLSMSGSFHLANQRIDKSVDVDSEWKTIVFDDPLDLDHDVVQLLHIGLDPALYEDDLVYTSRKNAASGLKARLPQVMNFRRLSDGQLIVPQIELIGDDGRAVSLRPVMSQSWPNGELSIGYYVRRTGESVNIPGYPQDLREFKAVRIRSHEPFRVLFLQWRKV